MPTEAVSAEAAALPVAEPAPVATTPAPAEPITAPAPEPVAPVASVTPEPVVALPPASAPAAPAVAAAPAAPDAGAWQTALYTQQMAHQLALAEMRNQHLQDQQRLMQQMMDLMQRKMM
ncbi:hypothetical protein [Hymenobacter sp. UYP22]|uniref:hypothetical protein n=1 Tax=Hymenobacter sp. UYP22 TaxID=3156348 RepID=UPI00339A213E